MIASGTTTYSRIGRPRIGSSVLPPALALKTSFYSWHLLPEPRWVGLHNYAFMPSSGELAGDAARTPGYSAIVVVPSFAFGFFFGIALNRRGAVYAFVRGAVFSAYVV